jgi:hypothetical protein
MSYDEAESYWLASKAFIPCQAMLPVQGSTCCQHRVETTVQGCSQLVTQLAMIAAKRGWCRQLVVHQSSRYGVQHVAPQAFTSQHAAELLHSSVMFTVH